MDTQHYSSYSFNIPTFFVRDGGTLYEAAEVMPAGRAEHPDALAHYGSDVYKMLLRHLGRYEAMAHPRHSEEVKIESLLKEFFHVKKIIGQ